MRKHYCSHLDFILTPIYTNSQNQIRLHKIGQRDRKISIFLSDFLQSDLILAVRVNAGLSLCLKHLAKNSPKFTFENAA
jgi:hypothetical protein